MDVDEQHDENGRKHHYPEPRATGGDVASVAEKETYGSHLQKQAESAGKKEQIPLHSSLITPSEVDVGSSDALREESDTDYIA